MLSSQMFARTLLVASVAISVSGCGSFAPQRYASNESTAATLRQLGAKGVEVSEFTRSGSFMSLCRTNFFIEAPEGMSFEGYVHRALSTELRAAGVVAPNGPPAVTLRGDIAELEFSASTNLTEGRWLIKLNLTSSNGKAATFTESFGFEAGFMGHSACRRSAEAFLPAVEKLIATMAAAPAFRTLLLP